MPAWLAQRERWWTLLAGVGLVVLGNWIGREEVLLAGVALIGVAIPHKVDAELLQLARELLKNTPPPSPGEQREQLVGRLRRVTGAPPGEPPPKP